MIFQNASEFAASGFQPQVVVIGSGPAGISLANKLAESRIPCVLLEAGGEDWSEESQDVYKGEVVGDTYFDLDVTRLRYLGGTSNHWAGWCRVLETHDFEAKPHVPHTGWPIGRADLEPYLPETFETLDIRAFRPDIPLTERFRRFEIIKSEAVRFGQKYRDLIAASRTTALVLNTAVQELVGNGTEATAARLISQGVESEIRAPYFVVATGGIENSRLLLWSNERSNGGVVPHAGALGRYWMEHPMYWAGNAFITDLDALLPDHEGDAFFAPSAELIAAKGLLNFHVRLETMPFTGVKKAIADLACHAPETTEWVSESLGQRLQCSARVHMDWEQAPRPDNRIALSKSERDAHGVPRPELHWTKDELDRKVLVEGLRLFGEDMARKDIGRLQISEWVLMGDPYPEGMEIGGNHHMGGTRMGTDPATSVVDRNCRVHGMKNLFVAGSSVFATAGQCTPTTTLVALATRLGDHLSNEVVTTRSARPANRSRSG